MPLVIRERVKEFAMIDKDKTPQQCLHAMNSLLLVRCIVNRWNEDPLDGFDKKQLTSYIIDALEGNSSKLTEVCSKLEDIVDPEFQENPPKKENDFRSAFYVAFYNTLFGNPKKPVDKSAGCVTIVS
jgi:hypothetical protein